MLPQLYSDPQVVRQLLEDFEAAEIPWPHKLAWRFGKRSVQNSWEATRRAAPGAARRGHRRRGDPALDGRRLRADLVGDERRRRRRGTGRLHAQLRPRGGSGTRSLRGRDAADRHSPHCCTHGAIGTKRRWRGLGRGRPGAQRVPASRRLGREAPWLCAQLLQGLLPAAAALPTASARPGAARGARRGRSPVRIEGGPSGVLGT